MARTWALLAAIAVGWPGHATARSATDAYLTTRDQYIAIEARRYKDAVSASRNLTKQKGEAAAQAFWWTQSQKDQGAELHDLENRLREVIGAVEINGVRSAGTSNVGTLYPELGFGTLDGLRFNLNPGEFVVVTTRTLFSQWLRSATKWFAGSGFNIPTTTADALNSASFYTAAFEVDVRVVGFGSLPMPMPGRLTYATTMLGLVTSDRDFMYLPDTIFVSVIVGDRIYIFGKKLRTKLEHIERCDKLWLNLDQKAQALSKQSPPLSRINPKFWQSRMESQDAIEDATDTAYEHCFAEHLKDQSKFADLLAEAQALIDGTSQQGVREQPH